MRPIRRAVLAGLLVVGWAASGWCTEFRVYSWQIGSRVAVESIGCSTFSQAREAARVLAALHQMHPLLGLDGDFVMVTKADDPLATWVLRSNEPFQPREYVSIGSKADKRSRDSR